MAKLMKFESDVLEVGKPTPTVRLLTLSVPEDFQFESGQFINLRLQDLRRSYSIASDPQKGRIQLCMKLVDGGEASDIFKTVKKGDQFSLTGPMGLFKIKDPEKDMVFVSTGTGISPLRSMIKTLLRHGHTGRITLLTGYRHEEEVLFDDEFSKLAEEHPNFSYHHIISRPNGGAAKGRVQDLIQQNIPEDFEGDFYLCGLYDMIKETKQLLLSRGVAEERIRFERYD